MPEMVAATKSFMAIYVRFDSPGEDDAGTWRLATDPNRVVVLRSNESCEDVRRGDLYPVDGLVPSRFPEFFEPAESREPGVASGYVNA